MPHYRDSQSPTPPRVTATIPRLPQGANRCENQERPVTAVHVTIPFHTLRRAVMLNPRAFYNSRPDGFGVLEVADDNPSPDAPRRFVPLMRTDLAGTVTGPL